MTPRLPPQSGSHFPLFLLTLSALLSGCGGKFVEGVDEGTWRNGEREPRDIGPPPRPNDPTPSSNPPGSTPDVPQLNPNPIAPGWGIPIGSAASRDVTATPGSCRNPIALPSVTETSYSGTTSGSGEFFTECGGEGAEAVFYFQAPESGRYAFDTRETSFDAVLNLATESCGGFLVACNDDTFDLDSFLETDMIAGQGVFVILDSLESSPGSYTLNLKRVDPVSSNCPGQSLGSNTGTRLVSESIGDSPPSTSPDVQPCGAGPPVSSYAWTAPRTGTFVFSTAGSNFDTVLTVLARCGGSVVSCNDDVSDETSFLQLDLTAGESIFLEISNWWGDTVTNRSLVLSITEI